MSCSPKGLWQNKIPKRNACPPLFKPSGTQFPVEPYRLQVLPTFAAAGISKKFMPAVIIDWGNRRKGGTSDR
jgi:hypothetical protein